jgi:ABC-type antimicrobial peptide transport system permease subunit
MLERLQFYLSHSFNDLKVNGQRSFFAILCIGAGVAAIVSLQTLAVMIESTLTGNLRQQNTGDIQATYEGFTFGDPDIQAQIDEAEANGDGPRFGDDQQARREARENYDEALELARQNGWVATREQEFFGFSSSTTRLTIAGAEAIEAALRDQYGADVDVTYEVQLVDDAQIILGNGPAVSVTWLEPDLIGENYAPVIIEPDEYPYYDEIILSDDRTLAQAFAEYDGDHYPLVMSQDGINNLGEAGNRPENGAVLSISGAASTFEIIGVVPTNTEIRQLQDGFRFGFFGNYYYLDVPTYQQAFGLEDDLIRTLYIRIGDTIPLTDVSRTLVQEFPYLAQTTIEDLREQNEAIADDLETIVTVMGLLGLLLGSIGIINTMQVVVRRRTLEIAVLKTLGLQGRQITLLFLTQAFIMGVLGSILGVLLGWLAVFVLRGSAESFLRQGLAFQVALAPVVNGVIVGTLVTTVFGFLPTLSAAQVRPGNVLRPADSVVPRAGCFTSLIVLGFMIVVLALIAQSILQGNIALAFAAVVGAFVAAGVIFVMLWVFIWLVGRLFPSFGLVDIKLSKRQLLTTKRRGAITLLALVVAVFSLSTITLFADSFTNFLNSLLDDAEAQPVFVQSLMPGANDQIAQILDETESVDSFQINRTYNDISFQQLEKADGTTYNSQSELDTALQGASNQAFFATFSLNFIQAFEQGREPESDLLAGVSLQQAETPADVLPLVITENAYTRSDIFEVDDQITFTFAGEDVTFQIVGIQPEPEANISFTVASQYTYYEALSERGLEPGEVNFSVAMPEDEVGSLRRSLSDIPGVFVFDTRLLVNLVEIFLAQFRSFPQIVAVLGLIVGGVVIANSVALSTLERRNQIAVMKSVGLQRERVLGMLLIENGLLGLIGGLLGVGSGLLTLVIIAPQINLPLDVIPFGQGFLLMALCIVVALAAAVTTAWGASGEKPLNVLRYE